MQVKAIAIICTLVYFGCVSAQAPIPSHPDGYGVGGPADAHVVVEMFFDPLCPGCKAAWPTVLQLIQAYGKKIHVRIHTFPLPYHTYSFLTSQGLHIIANVTNRNLDAIYQYATKVLENQAQWYDTATTSMSMLQVIDSLASFVDKTGLTTKAKFLTGLNNADINYETRVSWKYACTRDVAGTPTFLINGVMIQADPSWKLKDWQSIIDPILGSNDDETKPANQDCPSGEEQCTYAPKKIECCLAGERCIPNVGCRCFNLRNRNQCRSK